MWIGNTYISDFETLNKIFIRFDDMEKDSFYKKSRWGGNVPENFGMNRYISQWCRENHISYRKIKTYNMTIETTTQISKTGETFGLLFYCEEDAMAFKLRWME